MMADSIFDAWRLGIATFKGFGAISRSFSNRALKTAYFQLGEIPKCPTDDRFAKILGVFCHVPRPAGAFFGPSLLSNSKK